MNTEQRVKIYILRNPACSEYTKDELDKTLTTEQIEEDINEFQASGWIVKNITQTTTNVTPGASLYQQCPLAVITFILEKP